MTKPLNKKLQNILTAVTLGGVVLVTFPVAAMAHAVVRPAEVTTASSQTFTVGVPNEKNMPTTALRLELPAGLQRVSPIVKPGWTINVERDGDTVKTISWTGGSIDEGLKDDFMFSAKTPADEVELVWKAYQTYADGTVVSWDQSDDSKVEGGSKGPFSITKVVNKTELENQLAEVEQAASDAKVSARRSLIVTIAALALGLIALALAFQKKA